uniref:homoserine dehydrogenase n=1 Tax=Fagus sylvatica TaxID=28930 RepID=A0A2N9FMU5_FAGSY
MKTIPVILMGCGGVGRHLLHHIVSCRSLHAKLGVHLRVVGVCDSKSSIIVSDVFFMELDEKFLLELCQLKSNGSSLLTLSSSGIEYQVLNNSDSTTKLIEIADLLGKSIGLAFVDCSASSETIGVLKRVVGLGCCIVMANKKPLTSTMEDYDKLVSHPRRVRHESTVGAGLPVIASLNRILSSGDTVHRIVGSLSGTLGYVMSEVEDGKPLSQVVKAAKSLGYTEPGKLPCGAIGGLLSRGGSKGPLPWPDPRDDLSGMDVARKALILARLLGWRINLDSIKIESLYPEVMGSNVMSVEDFLDSGLLLLDKDIQERVNKASLNGNVLRYVCLIQGSSCASFPTSAFNFSLRAFPLGTGVVERQWIIFCYFAMWLVRFGVLSFGFWSRLGDFGLPWLDGGIGLENTLQRCEVGIQELPKDSPLGRLRGSDNVLEIYSRCYNEQPLVIQGAGAGNDTTAAGVLADILDIQDLFPENKSVVSNA